VTTHEAGDLPRVALSIVLGPYTPFPQPMFHAPSPKTLPQGFVESVVETEQARRPCGTARAVSSPAAPPTALPLRSTSAGVSAKRGHHNIHQAFCASPSAASTVNSSLAGSRASSPSHGSRDASPHPSPRRFLLPPLSPGVGSGDQTRTASQRGSFGAQFSALLSGRHSPVPQSSVKTSELPEQSLLALMRTARTPSERCVSFAEEADDDRFPSAQIKPKGDSRHSALRGRRRTFDVPPGQASTLPGQNPVSISPGGKASDDFTGGGRLPVGGGRGGILSAILGLSPGSHRVAPDMCAGCETN
jgi:hypothetical protein